VTYYSISESGVVRVLYSHTALVYSTNNLHKKIGTSTLKLCCSEMIHFQHMWAISYF